MIFQRRGTKNKKIIKNSKRGSSSSSGPSAAQERQIFKLVNFLPPPKQLLHRSPYVRLFGAQWRLNELKCRVTYSMTRVKFEWSWVVSKCESRLYRASHVVNFRRKKMTEMFLLEMLHSVSVDDFDARTVCAFYSGGVHLTLRWPTANLIGGNWQCETASAQMESRNERRGGKKLRGLTIRFHANGSAEYKRCTWYSPPEGQAKRNNWRAKKRGEKKGWKYLSLGFFFCSYFDFILLFNV